MHAFDAAKQQATDILKKYPELNKKIELNEKKKKNSRET